MNSLTLSRCTLGVCAAATLLVGCGGLQPAGVTQGPVPQGQMPENPSRVSGVRQSLRSVRHASATETVLYSFGEHPYDGAYPEAGLTYFEGTLYGTTPQGGAHDDGTVFSITPSGTETVLQSFRGGNHGEVPKARLIVRNGTLYGTNSQGGCRPYFGVGCGTVFSITPSGHETFLYGFAGPPDGEGPLAPLNNVKGTFYGTTVYGGSHGGTNCPRGCGTVVSITPGGKEQVLYSFLNGTDGAFPDAGLIDVSGTLYSTTSYGGTYNKGTVFSITLGGKESVLHSFAGGSADGANPTSGLTNVSGTLYGTTVEGGAYNNGTVFSITPGGKEKVLHSFTGGDGQYPKATLLNVNGTLYGTTYEGGEGLGTVFSITQSGYVTVLHSFRGQSTRTGAKDGAYPYSGLSNVNGTLYGTTSLGGAYGGGNVYSITP